MVPPKHQHTTNIDVSVHDNNFHPVVGTTHRNCVCDRENSDFSRQDLTRVNPLREKTTKALIWKKHWLRQKLTAPLLNSTQKEHTRKRDGDRERLAVNEADDTEGVKRPPGVNINVAGAGSWGAAVHKIIPESCLVFNVLLIYELVERGMALITGLVSHSTLLYLALLS